LAANELMVDQKDFKILLKKDARNVLLRKRYEDKFIDNEIITVLRFPVKRRRSFTQNEKISGSALKVYWSLV